MPLRYAEQAAQVDTLMMVKAFLATCNWHPRSIELTDPLDQIDEAFRYGDNHCFRTFVSLVEYVHVHIDNDMYLDSLMLLWPTTATSNLKEVCLSACVTNLGDLIHVLIDEVFNKPEDVASADQSEGNTDSSGNHTPYYKFTGLERLELRGNSEGRNLFSTNEHTGDLADELEELIRFLNEQDGLETLIIDGFMNIIGAGDSYEKTVPPCICSKILPPYEDLEGFYHYLPSQNIFQKNLPCSFEGFEGFYNYLPHLISKPSFKFLRVEHCEVPSNTIKSMISVFLSSPTSHAQTLELECCDIVDQNFKTYNDYSLTKPMETPVTCGEFKSLNFLSNSSHVPLQWLFKYPGLRLKRLELFYNGIKSSSLQLSNLQSFSESLSACPRDSIETLCITFSSIGYGMTAEDVQALWKIFQLCSISELGFIRCGFHISKEDGLLFILNNALCRPGHLSSLRHLCFGPAYSFQPHLVHFRLFFDTLFSMAKEQLAKFTLDLSKNMFDPPQQQEIVKAWKANARGQKLKKLIYTPRDGSYKWMGDISYYSTIFESFPDLAVDVDLGIVL